MYRPRVWNGGGVWKMNDIPLKNKMAIQILKNIEDLAKSIIGSKLVKIVLFGSYAHCKEEEDSDIDIMILINDSEENIKKYDVKLAPYVFNLALKYGVIISVLLKNNEQFNHYVDILPFYMSVKRGGIEVYG